MPTRHLLGMLTPSSNTTLEPVTAAILEEVPQASAHFGRFKVTEIGLSGQALAQFDNSGILAAAELLSHARCQVIGWSGTAAGWRGFDTDERLCAAIEHSTGARACTSVLALNEILQKKGVRRLGLVTPYTDDVQAAIVANYAQAGVAIVAERHLGLQDNFSFSEVTASQITGMVGSIMSGPAAERPEAIAILCTNLRGAPLVPALEADFGLPVYDSVATVVWKALRLSRVGCGSITKWGSLFRDVD